MFAPLYLLHYSAYCKFRNRNLGDHLELQFVGFGVSIDVEAI
jgi:hypothetical protein